MRVSKYSPFERARLTTILTALVLATTLLALEAERAQAAAAGSCQSKLAACTNNLNSCTSNQNTLTNNLNTCNSNESTCTNSLNSCVNSLAALQGGTTGSTTRLLYPYVTTVTGFDTGLAISNTSLDPFGTTNQSGKCTLTFFDGSAKPPTFTTPIIPAGTTFTMLVSSIEQNGTGYMTAECSFAFAHGFAAVTDVGAKGVFSSYLALVISKEARVFPEGLDQ